MNKTQFLSMALPHGIKFDIYSDLYKYPVMQGLRKNYIEFNYHGTYLSFHKDFIGKPILRPLSDIKKEILHNGEKFIPSVTLRLSYPSEMIGLNPSTWSFRVIQKLVEWHFDICGLIGKGEAIDYHTLPDFVF